MTAALVDRLLPALGENGVLGLGEPTHGSAEAVAWKFEIIHDLARRGLLATLAVEESYAVGRRVDAALRGEGDLDAAWDLGSSLWNTTTIRKGMRRLRRIGGGVGFVGFDVSKPYLTARALLALGHEGPVLRAVAARTMLGGEDVAALENLCRAIEADEDRCSAPLARQLRRYADAYLAAPDLARLHRRDVHMARTLLENLPAQGITVVWAHNEHLARTPDSFGGPAMGYVLHDVLGDRYVPVGVLCGEGECRAVDPSTGSDDYSAVPLPSIRPGTTEDALRALGTGFVTTEEFTHPGPRRFLGWAIDTSLFDQPEASRATFEVNRPSTDFAALAYLPWSTADVTAPASA
ncbi:erythromycin esterase family protein [Brachybacterium sp. YJGR34]|uniref:erythromycin esterase family protein n=1 Tax=Brachybacterium sp. YJGR34 TaxID=2059911 RepID=UPI000E0C52B8|nr:erythromycin esterase family protein [Brachybacterium sp. YJGR34]